MSAYFSDELSGSDCIDFCARVKLLELDGYSWARVGQISQVPYNSLENSKGLNYNYLQVTGILTGNLIGLWTEITRTMSEIVCFVYL